MLDKMPKGWHYTLDQIEMSAKDKPKQLNAMFSYAHMNNARYSGDVLLQAVKHLNGHQDLKQKAKYCYIQNNILLYFMGALGHVQCEDMADLVCSCIESGRHWVSVELFPRFDSKMSIYYDIQCSFINPQPDEDGEDMDYFIVHRTNNEELAKIIIEFLKIMHDEIKTIPA
jgi:hypothetical protein